MVNVKAIQVYCGSKDDVDPVFLKAGQGKLSFFVFTFREIKYRFLSLGS